MKKRHQKKRSDIKKQCLMTGKHSGSFGNWVIRSVLTREQLAYRTHLRSLRRASKIGRNSGIEFWRGEKWDIQATWQTKSGKQSSRYCRSRRKQDPPCGQSGKFWTGYFINLRMVVIGRTYPEICRPILLCSGITSSGVKMASSTLLWLSYMDEYVNKSKKTTVDDPNHDWFTSGQKYL